MKFLFVCTVGGHLAQLHELRDRLALPTDEVEWATHRTSHSEPLLVDETVHWVPYIGERDILGVLRTVPMAWRLLRRGDHDVVVSTGSAIALSFLPLARLMGIHVAFIDSAAMRNSHTRTGRALRWFPGIDMYTQSDMTATRPWQYIGSVFDNFRSTRLTSTIEPERIVVTVGTSQEFGFRRLVERVRAIAPPDVDILWQTGVTEVSDLDIAASPWVSSAEMDAAIARCDAVVSHAGGGSALSALAGGRLPVLVPRSERHGEFNDDHQIEIADRLAVDRLAIRRDVETLTWDDIVEASQWHITRSEQIEPLPVRSDALGRRRRSMWWSSRPQRAS